MPVFWQDSFENESGPEVGGGTRTATGHTDTDNGTGPTDLDDDGIITPSTNAAELGAGGVDNFFVRTDQARQTDTSNDNGFAASAGDDIGFDRNYTGRDGDFYWYSEDVEDSDGNGNVPGLGIIDWAGIDITGQTNIVFSGLFAGRDTGINVEVNDFIRVEYSIDGGAYQTGLQWLGTGSGGWRRDDDLDGAITAADSGDLLDTSFANISFNVAGTGSTLALRIHVADNEDDGTGSPSGGGSEEFAFDNFRLENTDLNASQRVDFFQDSFENEASVEVGTVTREALNHADTDNGSGPFDTNGDGTIDATDLAEFDPANEANYFVRTERDSSQSSVSINQSFTGTDGDWLWRSEDVRDSQGDATPNDDLGIIEWASIDITGLTSIEFDGLFAARTSVTVEDGDRIAVEYSIDGGSFQTGLQFLGTGDQVWSWDENADGTIAASESTDLSTVLTNYNFAIAATGSLLTLRYVVQDFAAASSSDGGNEETAADNFRLSSLVQDTTLDGTPLRDVFDGGASGDTLSGLGGNDLLRSMTVMIR